MQDRKHSVMGKFHLLKARERLEKGRRQEKRRGEDMNTNSRLRICQQYTVIKLSRDCLLLIDKSNNSVDLNSLKLCNMLYVPTHIHSCECIHIS